MAYNNIALEILNGPNSNRIKQNEGLIDCIKI